MTDGVTELGVFDDGDFRWRVRRCSTPAGSWIEVHSYERDVDDGDLYVMTNVMELPAGVARKIGQAISVELEVPLNVEATAGDLLVETIRLLNQARQKDLLGFMATLREVHADRETISVVIGQLVHLTLAAMIELLDGDHDDGEDVDSVLHRWLTEAVGVAEGEQFDDAEIADFLDRQRGRDE